MILPTPRLECDLVRSMGALAVLRRRPALMTVVAEFWACQERAVAMSVDESRDGCGSCARGREGCHQRDYPIFPAGGGEAGERTLLGDEAVV